MTGNDMIQDYKKQQMVELFNTYEGEEPSTLKEYVEREAANDPRFFSWLFDDDEMDDFPRLSEEQEQEYREYIESL